MKMHLLNKVLLAVFIFSTAAFAELKITQINIASPSIELTVETTPSQFYQVRCCTNLTKSMWIDLGSRFEATSATSIRPVDTEASSCYFRVVEVDTLTLPPAPTSLPPAFPAAS